MLHHTARPPTVARASEREEDSASCQLLHELAAAAAQDMPSLVSQNGNVGGSESPVLRAKLPTRKRVTKRKAENDSVEDLGGHVAKRRSPSRDVENISGNDGELGYHEANGADQPAVTSGQKVANKHKKFTDGEDEEPVVSTAIANGSSVGRSEPRQSEGSDASDDDEAPEAITAAAGFESSRSMTAQAAKVLEKQASDRRKKRRDHDARLKSQAQTAQTVKKPRHHRRSRSRSKSATAESDLPPPLLPDSILSAAPPLLSPPSPSTALNPVPKAGSGALGTDAASKTSRKKLLLDTKDPRPPKDLKRDGKTKVRVLPAPHALLPPKAARSSSRLLREAWLMGRRGGGTPGNGRGNSGRTAVRKKGVERKKWRSGGFLVKK